MTITGRISKILKCRKKISKSLKKSQNPPIDNIFDPVCSSKNSKSYSKLLTFISKPTVFYLNDINIDILKAFILICRKLFPGKAEKTNLIVGVPS